MRQHLPKPKCTSGSNKVVYIGGSEAMDQSKCDGQTGQDSLFERRFRCLWSPIYLSIYGFQKFSWNTSIITQPLLSFCPLVSTAAHVLMCSPLCCIFIYFNILTNILALYEYCVQQCVAFRHNELWLILRAFRFPQFPLHLIASGSILNTFCAGHLLFVLWISFWIQYLCCGVFLLIHKAGCEVLQNTLSLGDQRDSIAFLRLVGMLFHWSISL